MIKIISVTCCPEDTCKDIIIKDVTNLGNRREKNTHLLDPLHVTSTAQKTPSPGSKSALTGVKGGK